MYFAINIKSGLGISSETTTLFNVGYEYVRSVPLNYFKGSHVSCKESCFGEFVKSRNIMPKVSHPTLMIVSL